ncbi:MAG: VWA-like domain-containing protein [Thiogranum sp.]|jgi:predicted metal-dependent peptidase|nr:VWA-like domain-containing protein [Thiogranum sp.]
MTDEIETKLSAARTRLILDRPFLGALVLRLPMTATKPERCKTIGTDVRALYYNPEYIRNLSLEQTQFVLAHEALHCALSHFARRQHRVKHRWDIACDLAINPLLIKDGLKPPPGVLLKSGFEGMMAEEIYPFIEDDMQDETHDEHFYDQENRSSGSSSGSQPLDHDQEQGGGAGAAGSDGDSQSGGEGPRPLSETEQEQLAVQWRQRLAGAAQQAMQTGKLGAAMARLVEHLLQPQLPWRMLLARYMTAVARDDYSYQRPSRREGDALLPTLKSTQVDVIVVLDTSGSINDTEMREFVSEIDAIKGQMRARLTLHACDATLCEHGPWVFEPWEEFSMPGNVYGRGGTRFTPPFEWLQREGRQPDLLVYFTDAEGEFPKGEPDYPVLWLVKGRAKVPWGQRIQLN